MFDFSIVTQWVHSLLTSFMPEELAVAHRMYSNWRMYHVGIRSYCYHYDFHGT